MRHLDLAIRSHGGKTNWADLDHLLIEMKSLTGLLPTLKGVGKTFPAFKKAKIYPKRFRLEFLDYPNPGETTVFDNGRVKTFNAGEPLAPLTHQHRRASFNGLRKYRRWSPEDAVYFFGSAITTYYNVPFLFEQLPHQIHENKAGFRIDVKFPNEIHTHGPNQSFYFNQSGLLTRHDYNAEVVGWWASGAHFTTDYKDLDGFPIATKRTVYARLGRAVTPIAVLAAELNPIAVVKNFY